MKKFLISAVLIIGFGAYVTYYYLTSPSNAAQSATAVAVTASTTGADTSNATPFGTSATTAGGSAPPTNTTAAVNTNSGNVVTSASSGTTSSSGKYKNGTYTGSVVNAYYGNVQVAATISGGKLTNVTFLQYPNDRGQSVSINERAMPVLKAEAIQSQSANVDGVSGASDTDSAFTQSLASALAQAQT